MSFFSMRPKAWKGDKFKRKPTLPAGEPDNRQWEVDMGNGFVRIDNGAPPPRHPSETQPVRLKSLADSPNARKRTPVPTVEPEAPHTTPNATPEKDWREDYLRRDGPGMVDGIISRKNS